MPWYNLLNEKLSHLVPKVSQKAQAEINLFDDMVWEYKKELWGLDAGLVFENAKGDKLRITRIIMPGGAYSKRLSEVERKAPNGAPVVWWTPDAEGPNFDILTFDLTKNEPVHMTPSEFDKWLGGKPPKSIVKYKPPVDVGSKKYEAQMIAAAKKRKDHETALQKEAGREG